MTIEDIAGENVREQRKMVWRWSVLSPDAISTELGETEAGAREARKEMFTRGGYMKVHKRKRVVSLRTAEDI